MKWPMVSLGEILTERKEVPSQESILSGAVRIIEKIGFNDGKIQLRTDGKTKTGMILIPPGDLVVSGINAAKGAIAIYEDDNEEPIAATIHYGAYIPNKKRVDINFLWWLLRSHTFKELLLEYVPGGIKTELKAKRFLPIPVPLPTLPEQKRIVARIEELATKVEEAKGLRGKVGAEAEAVMDASLSRVFDSSYLSVEPISISQTDLKLNEETKNPSSDSPNEKFFYVDISGVESGTGKISQVKELFGYEAPSRARRVLKEKNIIMSTVRPNLKAIAKVPSTLDGHICSTGFAVFSCPENISPDFMFYQLFSPCFINQCIATTTGGHYPAVNDTNLKKVRIFIPPLPVQHRIVEYLDSLQSKVDELKKFQSETQKELNALMPSILDKAFKGSCRCPQKSNSMAR